MLVMRPAVTAEIVYYRRKLLQRTNFDNLSPSGVPWKKRIEAGSFLKTSAGRKLLIVTLKVIIQPVVMIEIEFQYRGKLKRAIFGSSGSIGLRCKTEDL